MRPDARLPCMKKLLLVLLLAVALLVVAGIGYVWFGPVAVGDKKVMLDFLLGRSIEPPTAEQVAAVLRVGGLGSVAGSVYGAIFMIVLPPILTDLAEALQDTAPFLSDQLPAIKNAVFGLAIIVFLLVEPRGLDRIWSRVKDYVRFWPFRY